MILKNTYHFIYNVLPKAKQSVKFAKIANFVKSYQPKEVLKAEKDLLILTLNQLPENFEKMTGPIHIEIKFYFKRLLL